MACAAVVMYRCEAKVRKYAPSSCGSGVNSGRMSSGGWFTRTSRSVAIALTEIRVQIRSKSSILLNESLEARAAGSPLMPGVNRAARSPVRIESPSQ